MRKPPLLAASAALALALALGACKPPPFHEVKETPAQIAARLAAGEAVQYVDVRFADDYRKAHAKGALHLTSEALYIDKKVELPRDRTLALYCSCGDDHMSYGAARSLYEDYGYRRLLIVKGGIKSLQAAKVPMTHGDRP